MFPINDWFDTVLVGAFLFGLVFTVASVALGFGDFGADADTGHDFDTGHDLDHGGGVGGHALELVNISSIIAFITWFSGATYLARNGLGWFIGFAIVLGLLIGLAGAWLITWFLYSFLRRNSPELDPRDWDHVGQVGRITGTVFPGGTGEMVYESHGTRHAIPARTASGVGIERNTEVVILQIEKGVAVVQPWAELIGENDFEL